MKIRNHKDLIEACKMRGAEHPDEASIWFTAMWDAEHVFGEMSAKDLARALMNGIGTYKDTSPEEMDAWISNWRSLCVMDETDEEDEGDALLNEALDGHFSV